MDDENENDEMENKVSMKETDQSVADRRSLEIDSEDKVIHTGIKM